MKKKKVLRSIVLALYWCGFGYVITSFILDNDTIIESIVLGGYCGSLVIYLIKCIFNRISYSKLYKKIKLLFYYLSESHKNRYYCLLKGDTEGAKEFEKIMKMSSNTILKVGPSVVRYKELTKKERKEVQEMFDKTKVLLTTTKPPV